jgi:hypothetical protein
MFPSECPTNIYVVIRITNYVFLDSTGDVFWDNIVKV